MNKFFAKKRQKFFIYPANQEQSKQDNFLYQMLGIRGNGDSKLHQAKIALNSLCMSPKFGLVPWGTRAIKCSIQYFLAQPLNNRKASRYLELLKNM